MRKPHAFHSSAVTESLMEFADPLDLRAKPATAYFRYTGAVTASNAQFHHGVSVALGAGRIFDEPAPLTGGAIEATAASTVGGSLTDAVDVFLTSSGAKIGLHGVRYVPNVRIQRDFKSIGTLTRGPGRWSGVLVADKWRKNVLDLGAATDVDALTETVESVLDVVAEFGPGFLVFRNLSPSNVQVEHLAAALRASSSWKDEIASWDDALQVAKAAADLSNIDPGDVLFGMT